MADTQSSSRSRWTLLVPFLVALLAVGLLAQSRAGDRMARNVKDSSLSQPSRQAETSNRLLEHGRSARHTARRYATDHVVVRFDAALTARDVQTVAARVGASGVRRLANADFQYVDLPPGQDPVAMAQKLAGQSGVVYAEPDPLVHSLFTPNDPYYRYQWNLSNVGMEAAWDINQGGSTKVTVAVLDTGVAYLTSGAYAQAPDLAGTHFVAGYDFIWNDATPTDTDGHGTHVTGTIAQATNNSLGCAGIAFNVNLMPVKVLSSDWDEQNHAPNEPTMGLLAQGIRWAVDHGANVINMSLGADSGSSAVESALTYAVGKGVFIAIAAGNSGDTDNAPEWPASYAKSIDGVVAVGAIGYDYGRAPYSTHLDYVELAAPGGNLDQDLNTDRYGDGILQQTLDQDAVASGIFNKFAYYFYEGTSMATPHVTGLAALLRDQGVTNPAAIEAALKKFASHKPSGGRSDDLGAGVIDARATIRGLGLAK